MSLREHRIEAGKFHDAVGEVYGEVFTLSGNVMEEFGQHFTVGNLIFNSGVKARAIKVEGKMANYGLREKNAQDEIGRGYLAGYRIFEVGGDNERDVFLVSHDGVLAYTGHRSRNAYFVEIDEITEILEKLKDSLEAEKKAEKTTLESTTA